MLKVNMSVKQFQQTNNLWHVFQTYRRPRSYIKTNWRVNKHKRVINQIKLLIQYNMLSKIPIDNISQNSAINKAQTSVYNTILRIDSQLYQNLVCWILQVQIFDRKASLSLFIYLIDLYQICDELGLQYKTKYLTKAYFDKFVQSDQSQIQDLDAMAVICLILAIQSNQNNSSLHPFESFQFFNHFNKPIAQHKYLDLVANTRQILKMETKIPTPYEYFLNFYQQFPQLPKLHFQQILGNILNLALVIPQAYNCSAEEIFYGSVWATFILKKTQDEGIKSRILESITGDWQNLQILSLKMLQKLNDIDIN